MIKFGVNKWRGIAVYTVLAFLSYPIFKIYAFAFFFFFAGVLTYLTHIHILSNRHHVAAVVGTLVLAFALGILLKYLPTLSEALNLEVLEKMRSGFVNMFFVSFFASAIFLFAFIDRQRLLSRSQNNFCRYVGSLTYSTYMLHLPIQVLILIIFDLTALSRQWFDSELIFLAYVMFMIVVGRYSYVLIERPSQNFLRKKLTG